MKKSTFATVLFLTASTLLSFIILVCCFQEELLLIAKETMYVVFTGCIFAIPSTVLMLILDRVKNLNTEYNIVYKLDKVLQQLGDEIDSDGISLEVIEKYINQISAYSTKLTTIAVEHCFFKKEHSDCLDAMQSEMFDIVVTMRKIKELLQMKEAETVLQDKAIEKETNLKQRLAQCSHYTKRLQDLF